MIRRLKNPFVDAFVREDDVDTLKTAVVVVLLLAVLYGVYVTLNQPEKEVPEDIAWAQQNTTEPLQVDFGTAVAGDASGATATVGDTAPWNPGPATAGVHPHDQGVGGVDAAMATTAQTGYGQPYPAAGNGVSAPQLITPTAGGASSGGDFSPAGDSGGAYKMAAEQSMDRAAEAAGPYGPSNAYPTNQAPDAAAMSAPPLNSNASVYAPSPAATAPAGNYGEPASNYGDPAGLSGNPQMVATAEPPVADSYADAASSPQGAAEPEFSRVDSVLETARGQVEQGLYYEALLSLSFAYNSPGISPPEAEQLEHWLDPLAGKVIYSTEHLIGAPYQLQAGETLESVAAKHKVPWQLLANINGLRDPSAVQPGTTIKVVPGPFHAEIDVASKSLTLFAGRLYAGRFAIDVNGSNAPAPGEYQVKDKQPGHSYYAGNAQTVPPQDQQNPYGGVWIDLGNNLSIHGTSSSPGQSQRLGCISLAAEDANDLYGILSVGSNVIIRR